MLLPLVLFIASLPAAFEMAKSSNAYKLDIGNTKTPDARQQIKNWVTAAVYPAIDFDKGGFLWCNGTIVHYDSFLNGLVRNHKEAMNNGEDYSWDLITYKAILDDGKPLWPSR